MTSHRYIKCLYVQYVYTCRGRETRVKNFVEYLCAVVVLPVIISSHVSSIRKHEIILQVYIIYMWPHNMYE